MPQRSSSLRVFLPFAIGYFLSYLFRVVNAVIAPDLVTDLSIDPSQLGLLTSTYFIAFASAQLPLGILLDRFGPKIVESFLLIFAGAGAYIFSVSESLAGVIIGRAFIGFGVSACLMAAFKSYVIWFPSRLWPRINGFQMAAGGMGALFATRPVEWALGFTDWRGLFVVLACISVCIAAIIFWAVPSKENTAVPETFSSQLKGIRQVFGSLAFWQVAPLVTFTQGSYLALQGLWAGPWLKDIAQLPRPQVAGVLFWSAASMVAGFVVLGFLAEQLSKKGISVLASSVTGMAVFIFIEFLITYNVNLPPLLLWTMFSFWGTSGILSYSALSTSFPAVLSGRVTTGVNLLVFVAAFIMQWAVGAIINLWEVSSSGNYHPDGYRTAFLLLSGLQTAALLWYVVSRLGKAGKVSA